MEHVALWSLEPLVLPSTAVCSYPVQTLATALQVEVCAPKEKNALIWGTEPIASFVILWREIFAVLTAAGWTTQPNHASSQVVA